MKIGGPRAASSASQSGSARKARSSRGFSPNVDSPSSASPTAAASAAHSVASVGALLALQAEDDLAQARRQAVTRADDMLSALDEMRVNLLSHSHSDVSAQRLHEIVARERTRTGQADLEDVLDQIEVRAAVELAKRERRERV